MRSRVGVKKLPSNVLSGAISIGRPRSKIFSEKISSSCVSEDLGVRRINEDCLEVYSGAKLIKSAHGSAIGMFFWLVLLLMFLYRQLFQGLTR